MPKTKISEFSATAGNNTDIDGINIAEGCAPSGINDAIRELMAQLKDFQAGTAGDSFNGPIGSTTPAAGTFTNLSASGTFALTGDQVQISEGGTGQTTANAAFNALAPSQSTHAGKYLKTDGTNTSWDALDISTADITGTLPIANGGTGLTALGTGVQTALGQNVTGSGGIVLASSPSLTTPNLGTPSAVTLTNATGLPLSTGVTGTLATTNGGTGLTSFTANGVVYASSSSALTTGSALTFDGTTFAVNSAASIGSSTAKTKFYSDSTYNGIFNGASLGSNESIYMGGGAQFFYASGSEQMRLTSTGLGIGTSSPSAKLQVDGANVTFDTNAIGQVLIRSTTAYNSTPRAGIGFSVKYNSGGAQTAGGCTIQSYKENATDGDFGTGLLFTTQANGVAPSEKLRLDSSGNLGLGVTPSPWVGLKGLQVADSTMLAYAGVNGYVGSNSYYGTVGGSGFKYYGNGLAALYAQEAGVHKWYNAPNNTSGAGFNLTFTQAMTLDASGNLGVGTTSPSTFGALCTRRGISVAGVTGSVSASFSDGANDTLYISQDSTLSRLTFAALTFNTGTTERARITSGGDLAVGTTSADGRLSVAGASASTTPAIFTYTPGHSAAITSFSAIAGLQLISYQSEGSPFTKTSAIIANGDGTVPAQLQFWTKSNGSSSPSERARITSDGNFLVGVTSGSVHTLAKDNSGDIACQINNTSSSNCYGLRIQTTNVASNSASYYLLRCSDSSATRADIRADGGIANYQANDVNLSDRREKTNFAPAKSYLDTICAIPVQTFNYIDQSEDDPGLTLGVVAQDVQAVAPELVMESNWGTEDNPKMRLSIYQTDLQYALMKCIQEQQAIITDLRARVAQLEAK